MPQGWMMDRGYWATSNDALFPKLALGARVRGAFRTSSLSTPPRPPPPPETKMKARFITAKTHFNPDDDDNSSTAAIAQREKLRLLRLKPSPRDTAQSMASIPRHR